MKIQHIGSILLLLIFMYFLSGCAGMEFYEPSARYNVYEKRWEAVAPQAVNRFNSYSGEWRYVEPR